MYHKILVALDHTTSDDSLLPHVAELAKLCGASLLLVHVANGWAAHWQNDLNLKDSQEVQRDTLYLERRAETLHEQGVEAQAYLSRGDPSREIPEIAQRHGCDLIAMTTHGHRFIADVWLGSTIDKVRHQSDIPLLVVRAKDVQKIVE